MLDTHQGNLSNISGFRTTHRDHDDGDSGFAKGICFGSATSLVRLYLIAHPFNGAGDIGAFECAHLHSVDVRINYLLNRGASPKITTMMQSIEACREVWSAEDSNEQNCPSISATRSRTIA